MVCVGSLLPREKDAWWALVVEKRGKATAGSLLGVIAATEGPCHQPLIGPKTRAPPTACPAGTFRECIAEQSRHGWAGSVESPSAE